MNRKYLKGNERRQENSTRYRERKRIEHINSRDEGMLPSLSLMTILDVAHHLKLSRATIYRLIVNEGLPTIHVGNAVRVDPIALRYWLDRQSEG